ncbi:hypothetical protein GCM10022381_12160 [Leifsonia kafniensis]|uniref:Uncharacterized protein n=1 Tax=Leifsonia kafniensis TaxID=475957 RepID=A0ABP7KCI4_9MICO
MLGYLDSNQEQLMRAERPDQAAPLPQIPRNIGEVGSTTFISDCYSSYTEPRRHFPSRPFPQAWAHLTAPAQPGRLFAELDPREPRLAPESYETCPDASIASARQHCCGSSVCAVGDRANK